ncbi:MAG: DUF1015 domain-containing protein [Bacteroidota bacterium]|nr:DUF1015 domain-containing protein [Bacteroidota bacterium]
MPVIRPFRGVRYNQSKVNIAAVVAPPYDVISPEEQNALYDKDPFNVVRLVLGREEDRYAAAAKTFAEWQSSGVLVRDEKPAVYPLIQMFQSNDGTTMRRKGFIALCRLEEFEKGIVLPHEKTLSKAKEDRFKLFKATNSNFSQVFGLYSDPKKKVDAVISSFFTSPATVDVTFDGVRNQLWAVSDASAIEKIENEMESKQVLIADGHHRYETALAYRDLMRSQNPHHNGTELYNSVMMFFTNLDDEGLVIFPTHRVIHSLQKFDWNAASSFIKKYFDIKECLSPEELSKQLALQKKHSYGIIVEQKPKFFIASLKNEASLSSLVPAEVPAEVRALDVVLLHSFILGDVLRISAEAQEKKLNIRYLQRIGDCVEEVKNGEAQIAFIVNPTRIEQVRAVARAGETMPQKSTFFYPKLLSGLVLNKMAE